MYTKYVPAARPGELVAAQVGARGARRRRSRRARRRPPSGSKMPSPSSREQLHRHVADAGLARVAMPLSFASSQTRLPSWYVGRGREAEVDDEVGVAVDERHARLGVGVRLVRRRRRRPCRRARGDELDVAA